jgi:hypothetical protein
MRNKHATRVQVLSGLGILLKPKHSGAFSCFCNPKSIILAKPKKAAMGEGVLMIYRLVLLTFIALIVFGLSAVYYEYYIDIRFSEAGIMTRDVVNCLAPQGALVNVPIEYQNKILDYCGIKNTDRFYVNVSVLKSDKSLFTSFQHGDSGQQWIKDIAPQLSGEAKTYVPGYFKQSYNVSLNSNIPSGKMIVEVLVAHE